MKFSFKHVKQYDVWKAEEAYRKTQEKNTGTPWKHIGKDRTQRH